MAGKQATSRKLEIAAPSAAARRTRGASTPSMDGVDIHSTAENDGMSDEAIVMAAVGKGKAWTAMGQTIEAAML
eukprot:2889390-Rhodomonas_salina.1